MKIDAQALLNAYPDTYTKEDLVTFMRASYITEKQMYDRIKEYDETKPKISAEFILDSYPSSYTKEDLEMFVRRGYITKKQMNDKLTTNV